jgi:hypothetical protein
MKMENSFYLLDGIIKSISVATGDAVILVDKYFEIQNSRQKCKKMKNISCQ